MLQCDCVLLLLCGDVIDLGGYYMYFSAQDVHWGQKEADKETVKRKIQSQANLLIYCWQPLLVSMRISQKGETPKK